MRLIFLFQIEEYMEQLPNHKVPKLNSPGEKYRDIQLIYQLPKQDLSRSEYFALTLCSMGNLSSAKMTSAEFLKLAFSLIFFKEYYKNSKQFGSS
ncbi:hypothetical protein DPMN_052158 [Dreissena polymorpha]|uniref:PET domain-containing protein n=1 Tax=Dreissena polymorpha TaxID=45954 RepID=A0A9D4CKH3_DREPO|nr:hypothetical protein DPMN_052158 [Dreissena polymorpha]